MSSKEVRDRAIAKALRSHGRSLTSWARWRASDANFSGHDANAFLVGVMFDRTVPWQRAWDAGAWLCTSIGDPNDVAAVWATLSKMDRTRLRGFLRYGYGGQAFHRHYKTFARLLPLAARHLLDLYGGDPRRIWNNQHDVNKVRDRLDEIPTIGPGLSRMAVLILARDYGRLGGKKAKRRLEPKPDVHVRRVFQRAGLVESGASGQAIIDVARSLAPDFPAVLDAPAWDIGRKWCRPTRPECPSCSLRSVCRKKGVKR